MNEIKLKVNKFMESNDKRVKKVIKSIYNIRKEVYGSKKLLCRKCVKM